MNIKSIKNWIFDMDGTLTVPIHDFAAIRKELEIPLEEDILTFINSLPSKEALERHKRLEEIELDLAHKTQPQKDIIAFLNILKKRSCNLGVITRNNRINTAVTLESAGLAEFFDSNSVLTRECASPKPDPEAIHHLIKFWNADSDNTVIIGDYRHDLEAGKAAGIHTIYFDSRNTAQWNHLADLSVKEWNELIILLNK